MNNAIRNRCEGSICEGSICEGSICEGSICEGSIGGFLEDAERFISRRNVDAPTRRLVSTTEGATLVEYAVILVVIASSLLVTVEVLSYLTRDSFASVSVAMESEGRSLAASRKSSTKPSKQTAGFPTTENLGTRNTQLGGVVLCVALHGLLCLLVYCRWRREAREASEEESAANAAEDESLFIKRQQLLHLFTSKPTLIVRNQLQVRHLMSRNVVTALPDTRADELEELMDKHRVRHLIIADSKGQIIGTVHHRDLSGNRKAKARTLAKRSTIVEADTPIALAVTVLLNSRARCLAVVRSGQLKGILTAADILMSFQCLLQVVQSLDVAVEDDEPQAQTISGIVRMQELATQGAE